MKRALILSFICVLMILSLVSCATLQKNKSVKKLYGTWINPEHSGETYLHLQKWVLIPPNNSDDKNGRFEAYFKINDAAPYDGGTIEVRGTKGHWKDNNGNTYFQLRFKFDTIENGSKLYSLWKLNELKDAAEVIWQYNFGGMWSGPDEYPTGVELEELRGAELEKPHPAPMEWYYFTFVRN